MIGYMFTRLNIDEETKEETLHTYSDGRTTRISQLSITEATALIKMLTGTGQQDKETPANKMRGKILSMGHEMFWKLPSGKIDMPRINAFCIKSGYLHKKLNDYTESELPTLVTQFEKVYSDYLNKV